MAAWVIEYRGLPVHSLSYNGARDERPKRTLVRHICIPNLSVKRIREQGSFKAGVLKELETGGDLVDVKPLVREYIASIARVHEGLRNRMKTDVEAWDQTTGFVEARFRGRFGDDLVGLAVVVQDDNLRVKESAEIFEDLISRRRCLEQKNRSMSQLRSQYVSSEVLGDKD
jgi:hypothetical protein